MKIDVKFFHDSTGYLHVWRDGVQIVNYQRTHRILVMQRIGKKVSIVLLMPATKQWQLTILI